MKKNHEYHDINQLHNDNELNYDLLDQFLSSLASSTRTLQSDQDLTSFQVLKQIEHELSSSLQGYISDLVHSDQWYLYQQGLVDSVIFCNSCYKPSCKHLLHFLNNTPGFDPVRYVWNSTTLASYVMERQEFLRKVGLFN